MIANAPVAREVIEQCLLASAPGGANLAGASGVL
jgi:hypothetical protein